MLSAIISTSESERSLVPTLNALFPAVMTGLLAEVIVVDAGSRDATREVADIAGCQFLSSNAPLGERLQKAVAMSRGAWLLFLPAGSIPDATWVEAVQTFIASENVDRPAAFRAGSQGLLSALRALLSGRKPEHGLLIARRAYDAHGGHDASADADRALLRKAGRVATLPASVTVRRYT
jgi:glycosyltransferase involved in cell wall biosynthesis